MKHKPPGSKWRILAWAPRSTEGISLSSNGISVFDELCVDDWFHLEQMSTRAWCLIIGDDKVMITIDRNGKPKMGEWYK